MRSKQDEPAQGPTEKVAMAALEEARMVLPGIQALFGFQLIAIFNERFQRLSADDQLIHFAALILIAIAIAIIMTPAAYHRLVERGSITAFFVRLASTMIAVAMLPLMIALCLEVYILAHAILQSRSISIAVAGALLLVFAALWFGFPFAMRGTRRPRS
jgi:hypothetical protein